MPRDSSVYLEDIVTAAERIASYVEGYTRERFGDILIHAYFGVDLDIVWDVVQNKVPDLARNVKSLLGRA